VEKLQGIAQTQGCANSGYMNIRWKDQLHLDNLGMISYAYSCIANDDNK